MLRSLELRGLIQEEMIHILLRIPGNGKRILELIFGISDSKRVPHHQVREEHLHCCCMMPQAAQDTDTLKAKNEKQIEIKLRKKIEKKW